MTFNQKLREWERLQERLPGGPGDPMLDYDGPADEDRCRMKGEDVELSFSLDWYDRQVRKINKLTREIGRR